MRLTLATCAVATALCVTPPARAAQYETFIAIETEEDLYDLLNDDEISEETFDVLIDLYRRGIDLNRAGRAELYSLPNLTYADVDAILAYRKEAGFISDPAALVLGGALSEEKLAAIAPFIILSDPERAPLAVDGWVRTRSAYVADTDGAPPGTFEARVGVDDVTIGVAAVATHNRLSDVVYDPARMALSAEAPDAQVHVPKFYAIYETDELTAIAGTYVIGFGQRLTFDNTGRYTPNGMYVDDTIRRPTDTTLACKESAGELPESPCTGEAAYVYDTPDYGWTDRLRGVAAGVTDIDAGAGWVQAFGFASLQTRSVGQYEIYDRERCDDPLDDENLDCKAPQVFVRQDDPLAASSRFKFHTLPNMFNETLAGGNVTYFADRRAHIGITGYGATIDWLTEGIDLDFQESARTPYGGPFGAVGIDGAWGSGRTDLYAEVARSFDSQPAGGGLGALLRSTVTFPKSEVETLLRYYDDDFANPYGRPLSAPDEKDGLRARDETGARFKYTGTIDKYFHLRASADFWVRASDGSIPQTELRWRGDYEIDKRWRPGIELKYRNKDLTENGHTECFGASNELTEEDEPIPCGGQQVAATGRVRWQPRRKLTVSGQYRHEWVDGDSMRFDEKFRQDSSAAVTVNAWPSDTVRLRSRTSYLFEDIANNDSFEHSMRTYLEAHWRQSKTYRLRVRYDLQLRFDDRDSTQLRDPSTEHWFWLEAEARF